MNEKSYGVKFTYASHQLGMILKQSEFDRLTRTISSNNTVFKTTNDDGKTTYVNLALVLCTDVEVLTAEDLKQIEETKKARAEQIKKQIKEQEAAAKKAAEDADRKAKLKSVPDEETAEGNASESEITETTDQCDDPKTPEVPGGEEHPENVPEGEDNTTGDPDPETEPTTPDGGEKTDSKSDGDEVSA